ncbi:tyrosine-type recombinase/integrase [Microbacterium sp. MC2]
MSFITSGTYTMTCPQCGHVASWRQFWVFIGSPDEPAPVLEPAGAPPVASAAVAPTTPPTDAEALLPAFTDYLESRRRAAGTIKQRTRHIRLLAKTFPDLAEVTPVELDQWVRDQSDGKRPETVNTMIKSLRVFYSWADRFGLIRPNRATLLDQVPNPHRMGRTVDDDRLEAALQGASARDRAMILLGRDAGLRLTEIATLHTSMRTGAWLTIIGKGSKQRRAALTPRLAAALDAIAPAGGGYYFPSRDGDGHMHPMSVNKIITRVTGVNPHALRHAAGTSVYNATKDLRATQAFLGHSSPTTTGIYVHVLDDELRSATMAGALGAQQPPA